MIENLDQTDRVLLKALQADSTTSLEELASNASISTNTCWRRVRRLEENGLIERRVALLSAETLGLDQTIFVAVRTRDHSVQWLDKFSEVVRSLPEVVEFYRMAGEVDYLLKIVCRSVRDYDRVYKSITSQVEVADMSASFAMECIKNTTELPI